jgi:hypothetical protein
MAGWSYAILLLLLLLLLLHSCVLVLIVVTIVMYTAPLHVRFVVEEPSTELSSKTPRNFLFSIRIADDTAVKDVILSKEVIYIILT